MCMAEKKGKKKINKEEQNSSTSGFSENLIALDSDENNAAGGVYMNMCMSILFHHSEI